MHRASLQWGTPSQACREAALHTAQKPQTAGQNDGYTQYDLLNGTLIPSLIN